MPITVPGVARYSIIGLHSNGRAFVNVFDYQIDTTGSATPRNDRLFELGADIIQNWQSQIMSRLTDNYTIQGIRFVDLNSLSGVTGFLPPDPGERQQGAVAAASAVPQASVLVKKHTTSARGIRDGRSYLGPVSENDFDEQGNLTSADRALWQGVVEAFRLNTENTEGIGGSVWSRMVVVHFDDPKPPKGTPDNRVGEFNSVDAMVVEVKGATIRRRNRG